MIKFSRTIDYEWDIDPVSIITDSRQLTKRASAKEKLQYDKTPNQTDVHIIALGAYEGSGANRNSDAFYEEDCRKSHHTFKDANRAVNRNHKNRKGDPKYGNIKAAAYNENMRRIELIVGLDNDKASDILHKISSGKETCWSMAARLDKGDVCSNCSHVSMTGKDRCDCIDNRLGEITKEGRSIHMINPNPNFFEISAVSRPADRLGFTLGKEAGLDIKSYSTQDFLNIYPGFEEPRDIFISKKASLKRNILSKLAKMEKHLDAIAVPQTAKDLYLSRQGKNITNTESISSKTMDELRRFSPDKLLKAMADKGIVFSPEDFMKYLFEDKVGKSNVEGMKSHLPSCFQDMEDDGDDEVNDEKFDPFSGSTMPKEIGRIMSRLFDGHSMFGKPAHNRVMRITITRGLPSNNSPKEKTSSDTDRKLANIYATYKLATCNYLNDKNKLDDEFLWNCLLQNR